MGVSLSWGSPFHVGLPFKADITFMGFSISWVVSLSWGVSLSWQSPFHGGSPVCFMNH